MRTKNKVFLFVCVLGCILYSRRQENKEMEFSKSTETQEVSQHIETKQELKTQTDNSNNLVSILAKESEPTLDYSSNPLDNIGMYGQYSEFQPDLLRSHNQAWDNTDLPQIDLFSAKGDWDFLKTQPASNLRYQR